MTTSKELIQNALLNSSQEFDLTAPSHQKNLLSLANTLYCLKDISTDYYQTLARENDCPLEFRLAIKLVESKRYLLTVSKPMTVGIVFAMWGEHNRLLQKSSDNPHGEDSLNVKINQLNWITNGTPVTWKLYPVDDGCPYGSASIASKILASHPDKANVSVLSLADVIPTDRGPLQNLKHVDDSRKGGAIVYGCERALANNVDCVVYTDADNSVHLGQLGLLLKPYLTENYQVVLGNRKHSDSILVKQEERWGVGIKTLRHMQRMIGQQIFSQGIKDTQAAFKLYSREVLVKIMASPTVYDFSFDTDWILAAMELKTDIVTVPFAFIDSAAESASIVQGPMTTWFTLLDGLIKAVRVRNATHSQEMAAVFEQQVSSHEVLEKIIDTLPLELKNTPDSELGDPDVMSPAEIEAWLKAVQAA
ncbi:glycosyltransferase [Moritella sp. 24]|uniref:glycosyltransferase n=1 Tax=Moritella sp. 24 TaxID=2746230 RepID=UPI001BAA1372|nr:glycosyltransferase [Moritella sp. 24]QUM76121.1 glycosyltransferase [Moritella sp. 24]